jgi:hypothetical protein
MPQPDSWNDERDRSRHGDDCEQGVRDHATYRGGEGSERLRRETPPLERCVCGIETSLESHPLPNRNRKTGLWLRNRPIQCTVFKISIKATRTAMSNDSPSLSVSLVPQPVVESTLCFHLPYPMPSCVRSMHYAICVGRIHGNRIRRIIRIGDKCRQREISLLQIAATRRAVR